MQHHTKSINIWRSFNSTDETTPGVVFWFRISRVSADSFNGKPQATAEGRRSRLRLAVKRKMNGIAAERLLSNEFQCVAQDDMTLSS